MRKRAFVALTALTLGMGCAGAEEPTDRHEQHLEPSAEWTAKIIQVLASAVSAYDEFQQDGDFQAMRLRLGSQEAKIRDLERTTADITWELRQFIVEQRRLDIE